MRILWKIGAILVCLAIVGCGSDSTKTPADPGLDLATPQASLTAAVPQMVIGTIVWTESTAPDSGEPGAPVAVFTTQSPAIVASIEVSDVSAGTEFTAIWTLNDIPIEGGDMHVQANGDLEHGWVTFRFTRDEGQSYPTGQLSVVITASSGELREGSVEIGFP